MKSPLLPARFRSLPTAAILALLGLPLHAATVTWDNSSATNAWSTAANWDTNIEPLAADDVILPAGLAATLTLSAGEVAKTLAINDNYTLTGGTLRFAILEYSGVAATNSLDVTASGEGTGTGGSLYLPSSASCRVFFKRHFPRLAQHVSADYLISQTIPV